MNEASAAPEVTAASTKDDQSSGPKANLILSVPFIKQVNEFDCGAAAFEMVYRFHKPSKLSRFNRQSFFKKSSSHIRICPIKRSLPLKLC